MIYGCKTTPDSEILITHFIWGVIKHKIH